MALPDPAVAGVRPNVLLHASVGLLLLGQLTVQLGYLVTGQELRRGPLDVIGIPYFLLDGSQRGAGLKAL